MRYCTDCGAQLTEGAAFCNACGSRVGELTVVGSPTVPAAPASSEPAVAVLESGSEIGGCRIERQVGQGGMGVVYLARQLGTDRNVALKVIAPSFSQDQVFRERFQREARLAALIQHPNVITVYDAGEAAGVLYLVMEYVAGRDLRTILSQEGRLEPRRAAAIIAQLASALDAAHARALVHRDVKPANVLVSGERGTERVLLTDFGLTKNVRSEAGLTRSGYWVGTVDYMAPEQLDGRPIDGRADVYALGCVLYEALTGRVPFPRESEIATIFAHLRDTPPPVSAARPEAAGFDGVVARALAKHPDLRFGSAGGLGKAAEAAAAGARLTNMGAAAEVDEPVVLLRRRTNAPAPSPGLGAADPAAAATNIASPPTHRQPPPALRQPPPAQRQPPPAPKPLPPIDVPPPSQPPPSHRRRRGLLLAAAIIALCAGAIIAAAFLTGLIGRSRSAGSHGPTAQALSNSAANLTNQLTTVTSELGKNPTPAQRQQIQETLARNRQDLEALRRQGVQQDTTGSPQDQRADQILIVIVEDLGQVNTDLSNVNMDPNSPQVPTWLTNARDETMRVTGLTSELNGCAQGCNSSPTGQQSTSGAQTPTAELNWTASPCASQCPSGAAAMTYDGATRQVVLVALGGQGTSSSSPGLQTWTWNGSTWEQQSPAMSPALTGVAGMTYDAGHGVVVLLGAGASGSETWTWDGTNWTQQQPQTSPPPVTDAAMAYDPAQQDVVLFGGGSGASASGETWTWDGTDWTEADPGGGSAPAARQGAAMTYDPSLSGVLLYGGAGSSGGSAGAYRDTWLWDGQQWQSVSSGTGPPATGQGTRYSLALSGASGPPLLLGADANDQWQQWRWTGSGWSNLTSATTPHASPGAGNGTPPSLAAFDPSAGGVVVLTQGQQPQTWVGALATPAGATTQINASGQVGPLALGTSTRSDVVAFAGQPDVEQTGQGTGGAGFDALGYDCTPGSSDPSRIAIPSGSAQESCATLFFLDSGGSLTVFATTSKAYKADDGLVVGMPTAAANAATHQTAMSGCGESLSLSTPRARLTATIQGAGPPVTQPGPNGTSEEVVQGGQVGAIYITAASDQLGLFDCIDS